MEDLGDVFVCDRRCLAVVDLLGLEGERIRRWVWCLRCAPSLCGGRRSRSSRAEEKTRPEGVRSSSSPPCTKPVSSSSGSSGGGDGGFGFFRLPMDGKGKIGGALWNVGIGTRRKFVVTLLHSPCTYT